MLSTDDKSQLSWPTILILPTKILTVSVKNYIKKRLNVLPRRFMLLNEQVGECQAPWHEADVVTYTCVRSSGQIWFLYYSREECNKLVEKIMMENEDDFVIKTCTYPTRVDIYTTSYEPERYIRHANILADQ